MRLPTNLFGLPTKHKFDVRVIIVCLLHTYICQIATIGGGKGGAMQLQLHLI